MPDNQSDGPVIVNNTPLVALWSLDHLSLLRDLYTEILIPQAVYEEFLAVDRASREDALHKALWIKRESLSNPRQALVYVGLDQGEAEVLALAMEHSARLVIIDERKGRRYANRLGIPLTGTLGVLLAAKEQGLILAIAPLITQLLRVGLFLTPAVVDNALKLAGEK